MKILRPYQQRVVAHLAGKRHSADFSDPGTGKTFTTGERMKAFRASGDLQCLLVVAPDPIIPGWAEMFQDEWDPGSVQFHDCRSGRKGARLLKSWIAGDTPIPTGTQLPVFAVTADTLRVMLTLPPKRVAWAKLERVRGRGLGVVFDESHLYSLPESTRARVARGLAWNADIVTTLTGTAIGRDTQGRAWGHTAIVAPWLLKQLSVETYRAYKIRYCTCRDLAGNPVPGGPQVVAVDTEYLQEELLNPQKPFTAYVSEAEALPYLPELSIQQRVGTLPADAMREHSQMRKELRIVRGQDLVSEAKNKAIAAMRCLGIASGWLEGRPLHSAKMELLRETLEEFGERADVCSIWAVRTRTLLSAALVAAGVPPDEAMRQVAAIPHGDAPEDWDADDDDGTRSCVRVASSEYRGVIERARVGGVGVLHGGTPSRMRDRILADWAAGRLKRCVLHPGVGGAGLNLQHCSKAFYVEPCGGVIQRSQSLKRHHRSGQIHNVTVVDLCMEGTLEPVVIRAHTEQREAEEEIMAWMGGVARPSKRASAGPAVGKLAALTVSPEMAELLGDLR